MLLLALAAVAALPHPGDLETLGDWNRRLRQRSRVRGAGADPDVAGEGGGAVRRGWSLDRRRRLALDFLRLRFVPAGEFETNAYWPD